MRPASCSTHSPTSCAKCSSHVRPFTKLSRRRHPAPTARAASARYEQQQQQQQHMPGNLPGTQHQALPERLLHDQHAHELSVVLLLNENIKRQLGRALLQHDQLLKGVELLDSDEFACIVLGASSSSSSKSSKSSDVDVTASVIHTVVYANKAARDVLQLLQANLGQEQQQHLQAVPASVAGLLQNVQQHQGQQQLACPVLQDVSWGQQPLIHHQQEILSQPPLQQQQQQQQQEASSQQQLQQQEQQQQEKQDKLLIPQLLCVPVLSPNDAPFGLTLLFDAWRWSSGAVGVPGWPCVVQDELPSEQCIQEAADAVRQQADVVRGLKTRQGLGNKHPAVVAAVSQLQDLKEQLSRLEGLQLAFATDRCSPLIALFHAARQQYKHMEDFVEEASQEQ